MVPKWPYHLKMGQNGLAHLNYLNTGPVLYPDPHCCRYVLFQEHYRSEGYFPEAIINFVTMSGGAFKDRDQVWTFTLSKH